MIDADVIDTEPMPTVDPTAELLGRAKARRPRTRLSATPGAAALRARPRKAAARPSTAAAKTKTAKSRSLSRGKKAAAADAKDHSEG